jgi:hypothetical protein
MGGKKMKSTKFKLFFSMLITTQCLSQAQAQPADAKPELAVQPIGTIPAGSTVSMKPVNPQDTYVDPSQKNASGTELKTIPNKNLYQVTALKTKSATPETADMQALIKKQQLLVQQIDIANQQSACMQTTGTIDCNIQNNIPVFKSGAFDFLPMFAQMANFTADDVLKDEPARNKSRSYSKSEAYTTVLNHKINQVNKKLGGKDTDINGCNKPVIAAQNKSPQFMCALKKAQAAYNDGKVSGKVKKDIFIINDFSTGGVTGKMWFVNADGTLATVTDKNPIDVSRGEGGFGHGKGSLKTPNGAIVTRAYRPPRAGNITDGIELDGLEKDNADIHSRGVLLHGWNPQNPTAGCLGVSGAIHIDGRDNILGNIPHYLDDLKQGLLKDGGVMIYNFTPKKADGCVF